MKVGDVMDYTDLGTIAGISAAATVIVALIKGGHCQRPGDVSWTVAVSRAGGGGGSAGTRQLVQVVLTGVYAAAAARPAPGPRRGRQQE